MATRPIGLDELEAFVAVAAHLHFGHAADACRVSTSALSKRIRALEDALDVPLLERTSRRVGLTDAGDLLLGSAQRVLERAEDFTEAARAAAEGHAGRITLVHAINHGAFIAALIGHLHVHHPDIEVEYTAMTTLGATDPSATPESARPLIPDAVRHGQASIGLSTGPVPPGLDSFLFDVICFDTIVVPTWHRLAGRSSVEPEDLAGEVFLYAGMEPAAVWRERDVPHTIRYLPLASRDEYATRLESGQGIALTASSAMPAIAHRQVAALPLLDPSTWGHLEQYVIWRADDASPVVREVVASARAVAGV